MGTSCEVRCGLESPAPIESVILPTLTGNTMKYMCLAYEDEQDLNDLSQSEWHELRQETLDYVDALEESGHLIATYALQSASTEVAVQIRKADVSVTDGPFIESKEQIGGFFLIEAADYDEAIQIASNWPSARIGTIVVRPVEEGLSMDRRYH